VSDDNIFVNSQPQFTDLAGDQLIPANIAGTEYGDVEEYFSHTISICAFNDGTNVYHNGFFALSLNKGQCINYQVNTGAHYFNSNKPVMLYSNFIHPAFNEAGGTVLASLTCNGSKKVILPTPIVDSGSQGEAHEIIIITKEDNTIRTVINGSSITIPSNLFYPLPGTGGTWVYTAMTTGTVGYPQYFYGSKLFILDVGNKGPGLSSYYKLGCISNYSTINLGPDRHICPGDSLKLDAGYGHDSIQWSNGDTTRTIMINSPGTYYVTVFDNDGCIHSDTIQITNFTISNPLNLGPDVVLCSDSIMLNAGTGRFSYLWNTGDTTQSIWIKTPGVYSVAVISNPELCLLRDTIEVLPSGVQQINIGNDTSICRHDSIQLDAGDGMDSYLWNTGETSRKIWVKSEGMYFVTAQKYSCIYTDTIVITYKQTPVVNLGPDVSICTGQVQTFDAGFCTGYTYSWDDLSTNQMNIGTNQTYITGQAGIYRVTVTGSNGCHNSDTVQLLTIAVVHVTIAVTSSLNNVCQGTSVTFSAHTTNGGVLPFFQWKVNGVGVGLDDSIFTYVPLNGDIVNCTLTSSNTICVLNNPATSNSLTMIVTPNLTVSVSVMASQNPVCSGTTIIFTATPINGGASPSYQWKVNEIAVGTNLSTYSYIPLNVDLVTCMVTSDATCAINNPSTSTPVTMTVNPILPVSVSISPSANPFCLVSSVTFTATPINGGATPSYQWKINGINAGTNSSTYTYNPANNDSVRCVMTSNLSCVTGNPASSNKIIMSGTLAPIVSFTSCFDTITTINAKPIKLKGGIPLGGTYSGPGVNSLTGVFTPSLAGVGTHTITYTYTNAALCSAIAHAHIINYPISIVNCGSPITDIRDNKVYPTVQIGSQCWLATNLNFGTTLSSTQDQSDNCVRKSNVTTTIQRTARIMAVSTNGMN